MQLPYKGASSQTLINYAIYTAVHLEADEETMDLSPSLRTAIKSLKNSNLESNDKTENASGSLALRDGKIKKLDHAILSLSLDILSETFNNRTDKRFKNIFVDSPSAIIALPLKAKLNYVKLLEERLKSNPKDNVYKRHLAPLKLAFNNADQAQTAHDKDVIAEHNSLDKENIKQEELRTLLNKTFGKLIDITNKNEAEVFFKKAPVRKKKAVAPVAA